MLAHHRLRSSEKATTHDRIARRACAVSVVFLACSAPLAGTTQIAAEERATANQTMPRAAPRPLALAPREPSSSDSTPERQLGRQTSGGRLKSRSSWWTAGSLVLVLALILVTAKLLRHRLPLTATSLPSEVIEPLGRCQLDAKQSIYLVRCGSQILVLGSSGAGLCSLTAITDSHEVDRLSGLCLHSRRRSATDSFSHLLARYARSDELRSFSGAALHCPSPAAEPNADEGEPLREAEHV